MNSWPLIHTHFPYLPLRLELQGQEVVTEALLDTGYDGDVVLPSRLLSPATRPTGSLVLALADSSEVEVPGYYAVAHIGAARVERAVVTVLGDLPLSAAD